MSGNWCTDVPSCVCHGYHIIICVMAHNLLSHMLFLHILSHMLFTHILSHMLFTHVLSHIYCKLHMFGLMICSVFFSYLATAFFVVFLVLLLIAFHVCPQINVQLHIVIPTLENKEPEDLENHFPLARVVTILKY